MRQARLAALIVPLMIVVAACSGSATSKPATPSATAPTATAAVPAGSASAANAAGDAVTIANFSFQPATLTVAVGATVTWTNNDSAGHTVTADGGSFASQTIAPGSTFAQTFATAGTFAYHCAIHPSMTATIVVP